MAKRLTPREHEIARLVTEGLCNKSIARHLNLAEGTVKVHMHNIYRKFGIGNRVRLAVILIAAEMYQPNG
jgi:two-component system, NarL family, nitrate/nitrite response regulator NarL